MMAENYRGIPAPIPPVDRWGDTTAGKLADVGMDSADWWAPTTIDEEADIGGTTRANAPAGRGGTRLPAKLISGQAGDADDDSDMPLGDE
jgi:hypothetical protein